MCGEAGHSISTDFIAQRFSEEAAARMREAEARFEQMCKEGKIFALPPLQRFAPVRIEDIGGF